MVFIAEDGVVLVATEEALKVFACGDSDAVNGNRIAIILTLTIGIGEGSCGGAQEGKKGDVHSG